MRTIILKMQSEDDGTRRGLSISAWLKGMGLKLGRDFTWTKRNGELHFMFDNSADQYATMLVMKESQ